MSGVWGKNINLSIFGESHGEAIGIVINGIEPGFEIDIDAVKMEMKRRAPGRNSLSTQRKEEDIPEILSGLFEGKTTGAPISMIIRNSDKKSKDYSKLKDIMRPGHADFSGKIKYKGFNDYRGGGHFSGRITAPLVFAGAIAKQVLSKKGICIGSHIKQVGKVKDSNFDFVNLNKETLNKLLNKELSVLNDDNIDEIKEEILSYKKRGDSIGGIIECGIVGVDVGLGEPFFNSLESTIAHLAFSIPAVKGIEFGVGFDFANISGSQANDEYYIKNEQIKAYSNNNGGITGGISNGMPIVFRVVIKPTPSISKEQRTINFNTKENTMLKVEGRHDPCIVQRALVVVEAIAALAILELYK
ncbi:chorismate synthase [Clostridium tarantellae]|uniref:Chorismate synthase n=1 Tax=Clostridium tarantellae TaxID=39493 RepID=A0A6I1MWP8_9CLOT|nr:chorismate synthase [Clostridium tarantellae]MPQ44589.1 chorismate synthase [Clostridium tarantellae]